MGTHLLIIFVDIYLAVVFLYSYIKRKDRHFSALFLSAVFAVNAIVITWEKMK